MTNIVAVQEKPTLLKATIGDRPRFEVHRLGLTLGRSLFLRRARRAGLGLCLLLAACGSDGPEGNAFVQYDGSTLTVEGKPYEPADVDKAYPTLPGRVVVAVDGETDPQALDMVARYGLEAEGRSREGWLLLKVPEGFESQWAAALTMQSGGRFFASNDSVSAPTALFGPVRKSPR
jgi:hypothetical protein